jgi:5-methylcytosine-specific restriction endonuclease McrA
MNDSVRYALLVLVLLGVLFLCIYLFRKRKFERMVETTSEMIKALEELNNTYTFWRDTKNQYLFSRKFDAKYKYDRCIAHDGAELIDEFILSDSEQLLSVAENCSLNKVRFQEYLEKINGIKSTITEQQALTMKVNIEKYQKVEQKLFDQQKLIAPQMTSQFIAVAKYTSPQGRNSYEKRWILSIFDVEVRYHEIQKERLRKQSVEYLRMQERSKMTPKLRYEILRRDGFRCKICGRGEEDGVKLHVDHIIPVSKGGKTEEENLRTLCEDCNLGKGARIEERTAMAGT